MATPGSRNRSRDTRLLILRDIEQCDGAHEARQRLRHGRERVESDLAQLLEGEAVHLFAALEKTLVAWQIIGA